MKYSKMQEMSYSELEGYTYKRLQGGTLYDPVSLYPEKIDKLIHFRDIGLLDQNSMNTYRDLCTAGKFTDANNLIAGTGEFGYRYAADLVNAAINRTFALQTYLKTKTKNKLVVISDVEPNTTTIGKSWIG